MMNEFIGLLWPTVVAAVLATGAHVLVSRLARSGVADVEHKGRTLFVDIAFSFVISVAVAVAFLVAVTRLRGELTWPERYWHWLPYIGILVAVVAPAVTVYRSHWQLIIWASIGLAAAWLLVPDWENLAPGRGIYVPLVALYLTALVWLCGSATVHASVSEQLFAFGATSLGIAAAIAATVSLQYGLLAADLAAALAGCFLVNFWVTFDKASMVGAGPCLAVVVGGVAFVGFVYPTPPIYELTLVPLAPLALAVSTRTDRQGTITRMIVLCAVIGVVVAVAMLRGEF